MPHRDARNSLKLVNGDDFTVSSMGRFMVQADDTIGVSVVGGDSCDPEFKDRFRAGRIEEFGFVVTGSNPEPVHADLTIPVGWVLDGILDG